MDDKIKDILRSIIDNGETSAADITAAIKALSELEREQREDELRKELFGV